MKISNTTVPRVRKARKQTRMSRSGTLNRENYDEIPRAANDVRSRGKVLPVLARQARSPPPRDLATGVARPGAQEELRHGHRRRRRPWARHRVLPRQGAWGPGRRGDRKGLPGRRQHGPQHDHRPLQLSARRGGPPVRLRAQDVARLEPGSQLQRDVLSARGHEPGAYVARPARNRATGERQPPERNRRADAGHGRCPEARAAA